MSGSCGLAPFDVKLSDEMEEELEKWKSGAKLEELHAQRACAWLLPRLPATRPQATVATGSGTPASQQQATEATAATVATGSGTPASQQQATQPEATAASQPRALHPQASQPQASQPASPASQASQPQASQPASPALPASLGSGEKRELSLKEKIAAAKRRRS